MKRIFCIDPGTHFSGISFLIEGSISYGNTLPNDLLIPEILLRRTEHPDLLVLIEDIAPYSVKSSHDVIDTCKFIGETSYRLKEAQIDFKLVFRWKIKEWVYLHYPEIVVPEIEQRIITNDLRYKNGDLRKPSFVFINDRNVLNAMKKRWGIEKPKPGKRSPLGLSGHAWQSLAVGTYYIDNGYSDERNP